MHHFLRHPVIAPSQALPHEVPSPSPSPLSPAELAQAYRDWRFRRDCAASLAPLPGGVER